MTKTHYDAATQKGVSQNGKSYSIERFVNRDEPDKEVVEFNIRPSKGGIIVCDTLGEAVERARQL